MQRPLRSALFVPGGDPRKLAKAAELRADLVVLDLEDAVAESQKTAAREAVTRALAGPGVVPLAVRINGANSGRMAADVDAVVGPGLRCLVVPKVADADTLAFVDERVAQAERRAGLDHGCVALLALIETARGIAHCERILAQAPPRLVTAVFGSVDLGSDLGVDPGADGIELLHARSRVVVAARAAGLARPVDGPFMDVGDEDGLAADCARSRRLGYQGRVLVHPAQVAPTERAYSWLAEDEREHARRVVDEFEAAERDGSAAISVDGRFVDYPVYHRARERLRLFDAYRESADVE